jgi:hypothetical protein
MLMLVVASAFVLLALFALIGAVTSGHWTDAFDPAQTVVTGVFALSVLLFAWKRYGFQRLRMKLSYRSYVVARTVKRYLELSDAADRLAEVARVAQREADAAIGAQRPSKIALARDRREAAERAAAEARRARGVAGAATKALVEAFPDDRELARDFRDAFPELQSDGADGEPSLTPIR